MLYVVCYRKGSVIVDFSLWIQDKVTDENILRSILENQNNFRIGGFAVDFDSIKISGRFTFVVSNNMVLFELN